jgi:putative ABC transport system substrate-binding protein
MAIRNVQAKLLFGVWAAAFLFPVHITSAQETKAQKVGIILQGGPWYAIVDGLRIGLRELGVIENDRFVLEIRDTRGSLKAVEQAARDFEQQKVNLIYTVATSVSLAAKQATQHTPIVFAAGTDPVAVKLVASIPRPGGRLTGVHFRAVGVVGKRLEMLRELAPNIRRVAIFYNPGNPSAVRAAKEAREAARQLRLQLAERHIASLDELRQVLQTFSASDADAYLNVGDAMIDSRAEAIIAVARANRLPTMFYEQGVVAKGGLASYSADFNEVGRLSAKHVRRVLAGTKPADLPVEGIDRFFFVINLKTAKQIGLSIPESILIRADKVIE